MLAKLKEADVPCARCLDRDEVLAQEQLTANDTVEVIDHPIMGQMRIVKSRPFWRRTVGALKAQPGSR